MASKRLTRKRAESLATIATSEFHSSPSVDNENPFSTQTVMQLNNPKSHNPLVHGRAALVALACGLLLTACHRRVQAPPGPMVEVTVVTVQATSVPVTTELSGRVSAIRMAEVRARVAGILLKRNFKEGTEVRAGDVLFEIDPAPLQAARASASAAVAKAEANLKDAQAKAARFKTLVEVNAVSKQDYDSAVAAYSQGEADVLSAKAALEDRVMGLENGADH